MIKDSYIYILSNFTNSVFYVGVTSDLYKRIFQHKNKIIEGFTSKYNVNKLVYYEIYPDINLSILREKKIKGGSREYKISLITKENPLFLDLAKDWFD